MKHLFPILVLLFALINPAISQMSPKEKGLNSINTDVLMAQTSFLASDWTEGRETGEKGAWMSADYIASMLQLFGAKPGGDYRVSIDPVTRGVRNSRSYFQEFNLMKSSPGQIQELGLVVKTAVGARTINFNYLTDFSVSPSEPGGILEAPVVFVGYGYRDTKKGWDDFKNIDVKGKFILRIAGLPPTLNDNGDPMANYRVAGDKDQVAISLGAAGIIEVDITGYTESQWSEEREFMNMAPSEGRGRRPRVRYSIPQPNISSSVSRVSVSVRTANTMLAGSGITLEDIISGKKSPATVKLAAENRVILKTSVNTSLVRVRNVVGIIEGKSKDEVIVLGAHYDHTGISDGFIYNGADDNASGTVAVLTIARAITATGVQPEKTIIFALWTGEEKGLLGSRYYVDNPTVPFNSIMMNMNFDMVSRYVSEDNPDAVTFTYTDTKPMFRTVTEANISEYGINLKTDYQPSDNPPGGSDHRSFVAKGIPVMRFKPGHREEYHQPTDEIETIDWDIMEKIVKISYLDIWDLANSKW